MGQLPEALHQFGPQDVLWLLAFRKVSSVVQEVRQIAASRGLSTLLLSDSARTLLNIPADHQIRVSRGTAGESQSLVVPMTIANAVILDLASIDDGHSIRSLGAFKSFRGASGLSNALL
jgi:DNA-binding MurR/RpiR family transcriptional regulator